MSESDVYRRQILTYSDDPHAKTGKPMILKTLRQVLYFPTVHSQLACILILMELK